MNFDIDKEDIINMIVADTIRGILADNPTNTTTRQGDSAESIAWIELHEDVLDKAYDMSKEIREYE